jgi:hypothetical protein
MLKISDDEQWSGGPSWIGGSWEKCYAFIGINYSDANVDAIIDVDPSAGRWGLR